MIRINLAKKRQSTGGAAKFNVASLKGLFSGGNLSDLKPMNLNVDSLKAIFQDLRIGHFILPVILCGGAWIGEGVYKESLLQVTDTKMVDLQSEKTQLDKSIAKVKGYEEMKKILDADEVIFRNKIEAISKLINERPVPLKTLMTVAASLPADVWLSSMDIKESEISLQGYSIKFEQISDFMKSLGENDLFTEVNLKNTQVVKDDVGMSMPSFEVIFKYKQRKGDGS